MFSALKGEVSLDIQRPPGKVQKTPLVRTSEGVWMPRGFGKGGG